MKTPKVFSLQVVLEHWELLEEIAQQKLAHLEAALHRAQQELDRLGTEANLRRCELAEEQAAGKLDLERVSLVRTYLERLEGDLAQASGRLATLQKEIEQRRAELVELAKGKKKLETLKAKYISRLNGQEKRTEAVLYDDITTHRVAETRGGEP